MANVVDPLKIAGLRDLQAALKSMDGESQKLLRLTLNEAAETVAAGARRRVPTKTGRARGSVKAASSQREARVKAGSAKAPYFPWLDYGGRTGRNRSVSRPFVKTGRYLYPTYSANRESILTGLETSIRKLITQVGLDGG